MNKPHLPSVKKPSQRLLWAALLTSVTLWQTHAQTVSTILNHGATSNRINLVILSEGYQSSQLGTFLSDATNLVRSLLTTPPYREYSNYFNAYAIAVASNQSGSDHHTPVTTLVDTYFNSTFDSYSVQRLLTIPPNDWDGNYSHGEGKVNALLQTLMPEYDLAILLVNDFQYGGSGGNVLVTSLNIASPEIAVHESGHTFGGLADEYFSPYPGWVPSEFPNSTANTNRATATWTAWVAPTTPIPTPATSAYTNLVGLFEGAQFQTTGWYRPKYDCKMNHLGIPFCEVCSEQLVKSTYEILRPVESFNPGNTNVSVSSTQALAFNLTLLHPATHNLTVSWLTNGILLSSGTNANLSLLPTTLNAGQNLVTARVGDSTSLVLNDPLKLLSQSISWNVFVNLSELRLGSPRWLPNNQFTFAVTGVAPHGFVIQAATNLLAWTPVATNSLTAGQFNYTNSAAGSSPRRYFRALALP
jgi:IgA Peptidase M64